MARIDAFLRLMIEQNASDLHFISGGEPVLRVDGNLLPVQYRRVTTIECRNLVNEITPKRLQSDFNRHMDIDFAYQVEDKARFRVSLFRHRQGIGATFRLIPIEIPTLEELNLPGQIEQFTEMKSGLVLVTGPTGCGKSTTLASLIDLINKTYSRHILTIEDPIEFVHTRKKCLVSQREIGLHVNDFCTALQNTTGNSADVVLVGELRDIETISSALTAAETGALVFGTLHTQSCASAISRIIDGFPGKRQLHIQNILSVVLKGIISQQLVHRKSVRGRVPITEIMTTSPALSHMIREDNLHQISAYLETADPEMNVSKDNSLKSLLKQELISLETAISFAKDPERFQTSGVL